MPEPTVLVVGTYDTKEDELRYLSDVITGQGGRVLALDVSVLGDPQQATDFSKHDVVGEIGRTIKEVIDAGDENIAMQMMAEGATALTATSMRSRTNLWQRRVRDGLGMRGAIRLKRSWGAGMWDKFTSPPAGRAHDEVTFRSGCEGRTLTIPQGSPLLSMSVDFFPFFLVVVVVVVFTNSSFCERPRCSS